MRTLLTVLLCLVFGLILGCAPQPTADSVVADMTAAYGGAEKLESITDQVSHWNFTMHIAPPPPPGAPVDSAAVSGPMSMPMTITYKRPDMIRFDSMMNGQIIHAMGYDGEKSWEYAMGNTMEGTEQHNKENEFMTATWIDCLHNYEEKGISVELMPNETIDEQEYIVVKATHENGHAETFHINPETNYIERVSGEFVNMMGEVEPMYMTMSDYQTADGLPLAHHVAQYKEDGTLIWEATMTEAEHNTGVDEDLFAMAPASVDTMSQEEEMSVK